MAEKVIQYSALGHPSVSFHTIEIPVTENINTKNGPAVLYKIKDESPTWILRDDLKSDTELEIDHKELVLCIDDRKVAYFDKDEVESLIDSLTELLQEL